MHMYIKDVRMTDRQTDHCKRAIGLTARCFKNVSPFEEKETKFRIQVVLWSDCKCVTFLLHFTLGKVHLSAKLRSSSLHLLLVYVKKHGT